MSTAMEWSSWSSSQGGGPWGISGKGWTSCSGRRGSPMAGGRACTGSSIAGLARCRWTRWRTSSSSPCCASRRTAWSGRRWGRWCRCCPSSPATGRTSRHHRRRHRRRGRRAALRRSPTATSCSRTCWPKLRASTCSGDGGTKTQLICHCYRTWWHERTGVIKWY